MTTKQMIDIFYNTNTHETMDLCSLEKYMFTHTFFETICKAKELEPEPVSVKPHVKELEPEPVYVKPHAKELEPEPVYVKPHVKELEPEPVYVKPHAKELEPEPVYVKPHVKELESGPVSVKPHVKTRFRSFLKDSLFWCMYVHSHGQTVFETQKTIGTNMLNLMMNEKREMSDFFNKDDNKTALKLSNHKITNIKINEIKCDLMTKPMLSSIESLIPCCVYWKCPIYVDLGNKTFLHFVPNTYVSDNDDVTSDPNAVLLYMVEGHFELELDVEKKVQLIKEMCQGYYKIPHYEKPLLGVGTYKTDELQYLYDMVISANDITCCTGTKMKKQELYAAIAQKCVLPTTMY
jgi:hypothetical protein